MKRDYVKEFFEALDAHDGPRLIALHDDFDALWERNPEAAAMATRAISAEIVRRKKDAEYSKSQYSPHIDRAENTKKYEFSPI